MFFECKNSKQLTTLTDIVIKHTQTSAAVFMDILSHKLKLITISSVPVKRYDFFLSCVTDIMIQAARRFAARCTLDSSVKKNQQ